MWFSPTKHLAFWIIILGIVLGVVVWMSRSEQSLLQNLVEQEEMRYLITIVAEEFRITSRNLTQLARSYCATHDAQYKRQYEDTLKWSRGVTPRPDNLNRLISEHIGFEATISQTDILEGICTNPRYQEEFREVVDLSNQIVEHEVQAMESVQARKIVAGPLDPLDGETPEDFANRALYGALYDSCLQKMQSGLSSFLEYHSSHSSQTLARFQSHSIVLQRVFGVSLVLILVLVVFGVRSTIIHHISDVESQQRTMLGAMPLSCLLRDQDLKLISANAKALDLFGYDAKEILAPNVALAPEFQPSGHRSRELMREFFDEVFKTGYKKYNWVYQDKAGTSIPAEVTLVRAWYGKRLIVAGYIRDMRDIKTREQAMLMLDSAPICCSIFDRNFNVIDCNWETVRVFQLTDKKEYAARFFDMSPQQQPSSGESSNVLAAKYFEKALQNGYIRFTWEHQTFAGDPIPMDITLVRHDLDGTPIVCAYARDLREEHRLAEKVTQIESIRSATNQIADTLMSWRFGTFDERVQQALCFAATSMDMHRISIYENFTNDDGKLSFRRLYAWVSPQVSPCNHVAQCTRGVTYEETFPHWLDTLEAGMPVTCDVEDIATEEERQFLARCGAVSVMAVPININGQFWGVMRFVDCHRKREFLDGEVDVVGACVNLFASAIVEHATQQELGRRSKLSLVINEIAENLMRSGKWGADNLSKIIRLLGETLQFDRAAISVSDDREDYAQYFNTDQDGYASTNYTAPGILPTDGKMFSQNDIDPDDFTAWENAMYKGKTHHFTRSTAKTKTLQYITAPIRNIFSLYTVPIHMDGSLCGVIILENCSSKPPLSSSEIEAVKSCAHLIAYAAIEQYAKAELATRNIELKNARDNADQLALVKTQFLTNMSHEIRTPMNAIVGMSRLLLEDAETFQPKQQKHLADIVKSADMLLTLINDLLDFSKLEAGKMELVPKHYYLGELIDSVASSLGFVAGDKGISLNVHKASNIPLALFGDDVRLKQVLWNTVGNAIKFTRVGSVTLSVVWEGGDYLRFDVTDTGIGIKETDIPRLFNQFTQVDTQNTSHLKGTGLGLSISKHIVDLMSGCIKVSSVYGQGSTFSIIIPYVEGDATLIQSTLSSSSQNIIVASTARILVVDDNEINRNVANGILGSLGFNIDTAESGQEAIDKVKQTEYDIVFMDHMMPEMDGVVATKRIRALGKHYNELTIIALTANAVQGARELFIAAGMNDFISKPIDKQTLNDMLIKWLPKDSYTLGTPVKKTSADDLEKTAQWKTAIENTLPEINIALGISRIDGDWDTYIKLLTIFRRRLPDFQRKLAVSLNEGRVNDFAIDVHGMKGALAGMGCEGLASEAAALERAAKANDAEECDATLPSFIATLEIFHDRLSTFFAESKIDGEPQTREAGSADFLREHLVVLQNALNEFDIDSATPALEQLLALTFTTETDEKLRTLKEYLEDFDYDGAKSLIGEIEGGGA